MTNFLRYGLVALLLPVSWAAFAQGDYQEGKHYVRLDPVIPPVIDNDASHEVVELFWYGCPHCFEFEPDLEVWQKEKADNISFVRVPAIFNPRWEQHARAYYALEIMGDLENAHQLIFEGIHEQGRGLYNLDSIARFLASHGVNESQFRENFNSFAVETKINRAKQLVRQYQVTGVPALIVDGTFKVSVSTAGGYPQVIEIVNLLTAENADSQ